MVPVQIGCGATTKEIHGRPYVYFWHYEERGGRRVQVYRYIGSARAPSTRDRLAQAIAAYYDRAEQELHRRRAEALAQSFVG